MNHKPSQNLHHILGVEETAGPDELRRAYLALAVKYHPDRNPGDSQAEERFKDISQAYAILSDPSAKAKYERMRSRNKAPSGAGKASGRNGPTGTNGGKNAAAGSTEKSGASTQSRTQAKPKSRASDSTASGPTHDSGPQKEEGQGSAGQAAPNFEEILANFFKSEKGRETLRDLEAELSKVEVKFKLDDFARWMKAHREKKEAKTFAPAAARLWSKISSWLPGSEAWAKKKAAQWDISYQVSLSPSVAASGSTIEISYLRDNQQQHLKVKIPAGTQDGARLRLAGQGHLRPDQKHGDLILTVSVVQPTTISELWR